MTDAISWLLAALSLAGNVLVIKKRPEGFAFWTAANAGWIFIDWQAGLAAQAALFTIYLGLSVYGYFTWK